MFTICPSKVSLPIRSARMTKAPLPLTVPPVTLSPTPFSTGTGSPVTMDSSTLECPSSTAPSTRDFVTRNHAQPIADLHLIEGDFVIATRCDLPRSGRSEGQQRFDGAARTTARTKFEHLTEEHQHDNHRRGFKIDRNLSLVLHHGREYAGRQHRDGAREECRAHADGDQRKHIQLKCHDGAPAAVQERPACPYDDECGQCKLHPA